MGLLIVSSMAIAINFSSKQEAQQAYEDKLTKLGIDCQNLKITLQADYNDDGTLWTCDLNDDCTVNYYWKIKYMKHIYGTAYEHGSMSFPYSQRPNLQTLKGYAEQYVQYIAEPKCEEALIRLKSKYTYTTD